MALRVDLLSIGMVVIVLAGMTLALWREDVGEDPVRVRHVGALLSLLACALSVMMLADSFLLLYLAWELMDWTAYLMLALWMGRPVTLAPAERLFLIPRLGDLSLFLGLVALSVQIGSLRVADISAAAPSLTFPLAAAAGLIVLVGGAAKVFPFLTGLRRPPGGAKLPTPIAWTLGVGLSGGMVYLIARIGPLFLA